MRVKLKFALPAVQTLLAAALLAWTFHWERVMMRTQDMPGTPPSFTLLVAINAPVALPRALVSRYLPGWWDPIVLVAAIAVFWYWVAVNIETWHQSRRIFMFSYPPLRILGDLIVIGIGGLTASVVWLNHLSLGFPPISWADWLLSLPSICLLIIWAVVLIVLFGRDLIDCVLHREPNPAQT